MLYNIVDVVDNHPQLTNKKLNKCRTEYNTPLDSMPEMLPTFQELKNRGLLKPGTSHLCVISVDDLYADSTYNRIDKLNLSKAIENLDKKGGFSYGSANTLRAFLRPDGTIVLTQGNHRTTQCYLTQGRNGLMVVNLEVHKEKSIKKCCEIEAKDFTTDNMARWNMIPSHKFKGCYQAGEQSYIDLYNFVKPFGVSIADTNIGDYVATHTFEAYGNLVEAFEHDDTADKTYVKSALNSLVKNMRETDIQGFLFVGLVLFQKFFNERINKIFMKNMNKSSFDDFIHFIFNERRTFNGMGNLTTQKDVVVDSAAIKVRTFHASRFVVLFNEYCFARGIDWKVGGLKGSCAIPESCDEWQNLIETVSPVQRRLLSAERM